MGLLLVLCSRLVLGEVRDLGLVRIIRILDRLGEIVFGHWFIWLYVVVFDIV